MSVTFPTSLRRTAVIAAALAAPLLAAACNGNGEEQSAVKASPCPTPDVDALCTSTPSAAAAAAVATASPPPTATAAATATPTMARPMASPSPAAMSPGGMAAASPVAGPVFRSGALTISAVTARAAPAGERSAAYLTVANTGSGEDALIAAASAVADTVEVHEVVMEGGLALCGGGSLLAGLDELITQVTGVRCQRVAEPMSCVALGAARLFSDPRLLRTVLGGYERG